MPNVHIVDRYLATTSTLGIKNDNKGLDYFIPAKDQLPTSWLPEEYHKGLWFMPLADNMRRKNCQLPK
jgi:heptosyltransferase-2